ncbi:hypothetical protein HY772_07245 [Candidatus Woesearchaeota archaeon]|nr:hypothetical protein [Candidatus Woesearchaeota archaeon]
MKNAPRFIRIVQFTVFDPNILRQTAEHKAQTKLSGNEIHKIVYQIVHKQEKTKTLESISVGRIEHGKQDASSARREEGA